MTVIALCLCTEACKKKIKAFEEEFERKHGYRVSVEIYFVKLTLTDTAIYYWQIVIFMLEHGLMCNSYPVVFIIVI